MKWVKVAQLSDSLWPHGILQARTLEWIAIPFSRGSSQPRSPTLQADSLPAEPPVNPRILEWVAYPFSSGSSLLGSSWLSWKLSGWWKVLITQLDLTLCDPMDCSLLGASVHRILQVKILEWGIRFSRGIFLRQGSNPGFLHCRWILYCLSQQGGKTRVNFSTLQHTPATVLELSLSHHCCQMVGEVSCVLFGVLMSVLGGWKIEQETLQNLEDRKRWWQLVMAAILCPGIMTVTDMAFL